MPDQKLRTPLGLLRFSGSRPVGILLALSAVLLAIALVAAVISVRQVNDRTRAVEHTLRVEGTISRLAAINEQLETARRGQMVVPSSDFVRILRETETGFAAELASLEELVQDNAVQLERVESVRALHAEREAVVREAILSPAGATAQVREMGIERERGVQIVRAIRQITSAMMDTEQELLFSRNVAQQSASNLFYLIGGLTTALLVVFLGSAVFLVLRYNRDLTRTQLALQRSNEGLEEAVAARTAELTRANAEIQRFAYIVSHDLRSPLVNVLGFTSELDTARKTIRAFMDTLFTEHPDLRDEAAWLAADEDLPEALEFIRKSTEKMDRLINSILELSRQGRRQLAPETLDMNALVDGVVASLYQLAEDAGAGVTVEPVPDVRSDRIAVEQIVSNLVENALKYLDPKRPGEVTVSGRRDGRMVEVIVRDNGRGIDPNDQERIFELFRRAGTQDQPGEGIGLANVRALAYRLGGNITVKSQLDEGATFILSLPETFIPVESVT
ncbi:histidine kinase [Altererythrobacter aerius]|uniref:histidine kinase n=1 Tax=Tsuneonella aeria TaxID=1837929 RepID=A0A6I4T9D6_9SPHN|nr:sensor histidine kinase [Tsuneonella aeria]MXO73782.1 histidine kinase [Tsuneonella aeria]